MKTFETPVVDVKKFDVMDVLTTSGCNEDGCSDDEEPPPLGGKYGEFCI